MSKVLIGSMAKYYEYRGAEPYLSFDGNDKCTTGITALPSDWFVEFSATKPSVQSSFVSKYETTTNKRTFDIRWEVNDKIILITSDNGTRIQNAVEFPLGMEFGLYDVLRVEKTGSNYRALKNGVQVGTGIGYDALLSTTLPVTIGSFLAYKGSIKNVNVNGYSYINQGDQNPNNILPSTPTGANGTISGAGWRYVGISGHYETVATLLSWLNSTTLTEPLEVILLEPMDTSGIPVNKNGWAINMIRHMYQSNTKI